jgi:large-conductance mechanosensitive channel
MAQDLNPVGGFVAFLREHAIVGLAVGFAIATQVQSVVKQLIASFIDPLYALLFGGQQLSSHTVTLHWHGRQVAFGWGAFAYDLIDFIFVLAIIYLAIKVFHLDDLDKPKEEKEQ